jgi:ribosomal protein S27AE
MSEDLEKYAVDEKTVQEDLEKKAAQGCPKCGGTVTRHGNVLICVNCGSEPFENEGK